MAGKVCRHWMGTIRREKISLGSDYENRVPGKSKSDPVNRCVVGNRLGTT